MGKRTDKFKDKDEGTFLVVGDIVKIRLVGKEAIERVWAKLVEVHAGSQEVTVEINNYPINLEFKFGEKLRIPVGYILDKWEGGINEEKK